MEAAAAVLAIRKRWRLVCYLLASAAGTLVLDPVLKSLAGRLRPSVAHPIAHGLTRWSASVSTLGATQAILIVSVATCAVFLALTRRWRSRSSATPAAGGGGCSWCPRSPCRFSSPWARMCTAGSVIRPTSWAASCSPRSGSPRYSSWSGPTSRTATARRSAHRQPEQRPAQAEPGDLDVRTDAAGQPVRPQQPHVLHDIDLARMRVQRLAVRPVAQGAGDAQRGVVIVPRRGDGRLGFQRPEGQRQHRGAHLLAVAAPACRRYQEGGTVDGAQGEEVVALKLLDPEDVTERGADHEAEPPGRGTPGSVGTPVELVGLDAPAEPQILELIGMLGRVHFNVFGQQVRDRGQVGLGHRAERQVGRAEAQVEQRPVPVCHPVTVGEAPRPSQPGFIPGSATVVRHQGRGLPAAGGRAGRALERQDRTRRHMPLSATMDGMVTKPVNLSAALATFGETYSPRIVGRVNDYDVRIAHAKGEHVWHVHEQTDEFFLVLDGTFEVTLREADGGERTVTLRQGDMFVVPKGTEHKPSSPGGSILMFEPSGTSTTGDRHEGDISGHVDSTTGHDLTGAG